MPPLRIDLFSDTVTRPTHAMRQAMAEAEVGDEQKREDPTTNRLQERVADLLGKEAALYLPSGTMCNQIAFRLHCRPGDEILLDRTAHPVHYEVAGAAALAGAQICPLDGERGIFTARQVEAAIRSRDINHHPRSRVVSVEPRTWVAARSGPSRASRRSPRSRAATVWRCTWTAPAS
jgi:threonine aldolase